MSKLIQFLVTVILFFTDVTVLDCVILDNSRTVLSRTIVPSFCPMLVSISDLILFRVFDSWLSNEEFCTLVSRSWNSWNVGGVADVRAVLGVW